MVVANTCKLEVGGGSDDKNNKDEKDKSIKGKNRITAKSKNLIRPIIIFLLSSKI